GGGGEGGGGSPCAGSQEADRLECHARLAALPYARFLVRARSERIQALTPAPSTGGASGSSGQRARAGAERSSARPRARRSAPAQAIMTALSVQSAGGGTMRRKLCFCASASSVAASLLVAAPTPATTTARCVCAPRRST